MLINNDCVCIKGGLIMQCCIHCFNNEFIQAIIRQEDEKGVCSYCKMDGEEEAWVAGVDVVGEFVREKLGLAYKNATTDDVPYHVLRGFATTIEDVLRHSEAIFSDYLDIEGDVPKLIRDMFKYSGPSWHDIAQGDVDEWESGDAEIVKIDAFYSNRDDNYLRYQWDDFTYVVKHVNRFFDIGSDRTREAMLGEFKEIFEIMEVKLPAGTLIWRARSNPKNPVDTPEAQRNECGPPPRHLSKPLRMNPAGISYFYGSDDLATCLAEIRPKPNDQIVYGQFSTLKPLRILDLSEVVLIGARSIFDPEYNHHLNWATEFLVGFIEEISKPIDDDVSSIEYVPTQILSEYIRKLGYDGVRYRSSKTGQQNYTLFCGREEEPTYDDFGWKWRHPNQIPEFTEWLELKEFVHSGRQMATVRFEI